MSLLFGAKAIARHLSTDARPISERQVRHLISGGHLPTFKLGGTVCSTPCTARRALHQPCERRTP
jgi:hypothetical protein